MTPPNAISLDSRPVLDLRLRAFEAGTRGIRVIGSWYMDPETRQSEPCLVLLDANRPVMPGRTVPCCIRFRDMWKWTRGLWDTLRAVLQHGLADVVAVEPSAFPRVGE